MAQKELVHLTIEIEINPIAKDEVQEQIGTAMEYIRQTEKGKIFDKKNLLIK